MNREETLYKTLQENPVKSAPFLSKITYWWLRKLFITGLKRPLTTEDTYHCLHEHKSETLHELFKKLWQEEKVRKNPNIIRLFWRAFGPSTLTWGLLFSVMETAGRLFLPLCLGNLLVYFSPGEESVTETEAYLYAFGIILCLLQSILTFHPFYIWIIQIALKLKVGCCCLIYEKTMQLSKSASIDGLSGRVINLMTNDVGKFESALGMLHDLWKGPLEVFIFGYFVYREVGISSVIGIAFILSMIPLQSWIGKMAASYRLKTTKRTDTRVKFMNEIIQGIQVIKMYTWENAFAEMIKKIRRKEVIAIRGGSYVRAALLSLWMVSRVSIFLTIVSYVLLGNTLTARKVFVVSSYFSILNESMVHFWPQAITCCAEAYISTKRVLEFLMLSEEKPSMDDDQTRDDKIPSEDKCTRRFWNPDSAIKHITFQNATAYWTMVGAKPNLGIDSIFLEVNSPSLLAIIGPVGSGKTTLLQVLIGELELDSGSLNIGGTIAYASQEPWLFESSIKQNIIFIEEYDEARYREVIRVCALERDLELFPYGDQTIVGERGISLSGGQKARVSLARAVYRKADIYLLDDPLSAVDTHVGRHIFDECISKFLADKICVLVTHQLQYLKDVEHIVLLKDAAIEAEGSYETLKRNNASVLSLMLDDESSPSDQKPKETDLEARPIKLNDDDEGPEEIEENQETGKVNFKVYLTYFKAIESRFWIVTVIFSCIVAQLFLSTVDYFVSIWVNWEETVAVSDDILTGITKLIGELFGLDDEVEEKDVNYETRKRFIIFYSILMGIMAVLVVYRTFSFFYAGLRISKNLHDRMFRAITRAKMYFFNTNASGRILNRFSKDIGNVDTELPSTFFDVIVVGLDMFAVIVLVTIVSYWILIPTAILLVILLCLRKIYINSSRSINRLESLSRSPIFTHTNATLNGLSTVRAYGASEALQKEFSQLQDYNSSLLYLSECASRSFAFWLDIFCILYITCVVYSFLLINPENNKSGSVGLAITQAITLIGACQWGMRQTADLENEMVSVERIQEYIDLPSEPPMETPENLKPSKNWPAEGGIKFENLSLWYKEEEEEILKDLNFEIKPREKVGIVGRTGAGKSSIIQALFRLAPTEGKIEIDGIDTGILGLKDLRSKISIIPQDPVLFSGTLRSNLDPFDEKSDSDLWEALEQVELKQEVKSLTGGLQCKMNDGGSNFSMGQRQLVCLARAILRNNQILILDEATANVDAKTDGFIQSAIRGKFSHCTVLTIAHRLHTVMDSDKILVMDAGRLVESGHPHELLSRNGTFSQLVDKTGPSTAIMLKNVAEESFKNLKKNN